MPHDLFILGCGRSGTSMVAGLFRASGHFQGADLHPARPSNPRGFFEDVEINDINETLLRPYLPERDADTAAGSSVPGRGQRWLARIPPDLAIACGRDERERVAHAVARRPFCFKDPRFCYTLHLWRDLAPEARMICVFRDPRVVVASILTEISLMPYLKGFALSVEQGFELWRLMYSHVLRRQSASGDWLFVEYEDLFRSWALDRIAAFSAAQIDREFPDRGLDRARPVAAIDAGARELYEELTARSKATLWR